MTCNKRLASRNKRKGFTLLETLVALAVLAAGAAVLLLYLGAFRRISTLEFVRSDSTLAAVRYMESQVMALPACVDTIYNRRAFLTRNSPEISGSPAISNRPAINDKPEINITPVPAASLQWIEIRTPDYTFRRLVRCRKVTR